MTWNDDIDELELALEDDDEPCDHEDFEIDILDGRARCDRCGESWWATDAQVLAQIDHQRAYDEWEHGENRRQWWLDLWSRIRAVLPRRRGPQIIGGDDIPF